MEDVPDDMMITIRDVRQAGHCVKGAREWAERNGISFPRLINEGIPAGEVIALGDEHGLRVIRLKLERETNGR